MKFFITSLVFGLTNLSVAMDLPTVPAPTVLVKLGSIQETAGLLQQHNNIEIELLRLCSLITAKNPEFKDLNTTLATAIEFLRKDKDLLDDIKEKIKTAPLPTSQNVTNPNLCTSCKIKKTKKEKWDLRQYDPLAPKKTASSKRAATSTADTEESTLVPA